MEARKQGGQRQEGQRKESKEVRTQESNQANARMLAANAARKQGSKREKEGSKL